MKRLLQMYTKHAIWALACIIVLALVPAAYAEDTSADKLVMEGELLISKGQYTDAIKILNDALKADKDNHTVYINLGIAYAESGKLKESRAAFSEAIRVDPKEPSGYLNRGEVFIMMKNIEAACKDWQAACELEQCKRLDIAILKNRCKGH